MSSLRFLFLGSILLLFGCASTGQLAGAGCTYNLCGQLCCANDGKECPLCDEWWKISIDESPSYTFNGVDSGCYWTDDVGHLIIEGQEFEDDRGICESMRMMQ